MALKIVDKVLWNEARHDYDSATSLRPWDCMMLTTAAADWGRLAIDNATANAYLDQISSSVKRFARTKPDVLVGCIPLGFVSVDPSTPGRKYLYLLLSLVLRVLLQYIPTSRSPLTS